jgi:hypothetical protein
MFDKKIITISRFHNPKPRTQNPEPRIQNPKTQNPKTQNPKTPKPKTQNLKGFYWGLSLSIESLGF